MSIYMILLDEPDEGAWETIPEHWSDHLIFDDRLAFISAENAVTAKIAEQIGIGPDGANGMVIQMDYYAGRTSTSIVEWLAKARD